MEQLEGGDFDGECECVPYAEYDENGERVMSNLMSGQWGNNEAVTFSPNS